MFLSRFRINTARPGARRLLSSPQAMHAAVMSSFPGVLPSDVPAPDTPPASCGVSNGEYGPRCSSTSPAPTART
ncbi:type I-E CRISPR-associated protein Cas6/Cse3/CasE [Streptomyces sp. NPDC005435]